MKNWITAAAKMIVAAVLLGEAFRACAALTGLTGDNMAGWHRTLPPVAIHLLLLAAAFATRLITIDACFPGRTSAKTSENHDRTVRRWTWIAGPVWLVAVALAATATSFLIPGKSGFGSMPETSWWIMSLAVAPLTEELVYRGLIARHFRKAHGYVAGTYFAAVLFAWVHTWPSVQGLLSGKPGGVPPGPLLLALICDWLYVRTGSLWPAIAFHVACNATPVLFAWIDPRWLQWFGALYQ